MNRATPGFTMIEVLVAVLIMGLVATASLKLIALSEQALYTVRQKEILIDEASKIQLALMADPTKTSGVSGDVSWKVEDAKSPLWTDEAIDIESLSFDGGSDDKFGESELRWLELEVTRGGRVLTLFLPQTRNGEDISSGDIAGTLDR